MQAAKSAYPGWSRATPGEGSGVLGRFARLLETRAAEVAQLEQEGGQTHPARREFDVPGTIDSVDFFSGAARNLEGGATAEYSAGHTSSIRREPIGVIGSIA